MWWDSSKSSSVRRSGLLLGSIISRRMKFRKPYRCKVSCAVQVSLLTCLLVFESCTGLNSRNYGSYRAGRERALKRETERNNGGDNARAQRYPPYLRRDWDFADVLQYFRNERLVVLQFRCFFGDGHCDMVGKWAKDRVIPNFFGICKMCTPIQTGWFDLWLSYLFDKYPDLIRAALIRYLLSLGIVVPEDQVQYMQAVFLRHRYGPFKIQRIDLIDGEQSSEA